ncbi:MAG TPA: HAMP domain-containing methyl-accepting chemotaxis protein [Sideroxyarcus sp.]|nr:HAMP domain-containing methyl-accepting chemotaxis protein [Sideroxyarcus sp.]
MKFINLTIRAKITMLAVIAVLFLVVVGLVANQTIGTLSKVSRDATEKTSVSLELLALAAQTRGNFRSQVQEWKDILLRGNDAELYAKYFEAFEKRYADVQKGLSDILKVATAAGQTELITAKEIEELRRAHENMHAQYLAALKNYNPAHATAGQEVDRLVRGLDRPLHEGINALAAKIADAAHKESAAVKVQVESESDAALHVTIAALLVALALLAALAVLITRGIIRNLNSLQQTIADINHGNFDVRARTDGKDELAVLAKAFNELLDNRVATTARIQKENEQLNESILNLLRAVAVLSRKDLTVKVPVSEDVTGAVSDALNLLSGETAKVLQDVSNISADVTSASLKVQQQSDSMLLAAEDDRAEVDRAAQVLSSAAQALDQIAELARLCNTEADAAIKTTQVALASVNNTVSGINSTRDVIRETEKRIKRLGERSQEISGVVSLINVIAERTHILALNASMHAASAGEAGRGFAVVADEVQRLAENARQATQQISALVNNIQIETADTVSTMNDAITQIVEGSRLAEQAGQQMHLTQQTTADLVASVKQIAASSEVQAKAGQELLERAETLKKSSRQATDRLQEQSSHSNSLVEYAKQLLATVRVFKLPA